MRGRSSLLTTLGVVLGATAISFLGTRAGADLPPTPAASAEPEASAGPAVRDEDMPQRADRVVAYTLSAELFPETHSVRGSGTIVWRNTARVPTDRLFVHLYLNAFKNGRTVFWRVPLSDFRGDPLDGPGRIDVERFYAREMGKDVWPENPTTPGDPDDATDIEVPLPRPIAPGESLTIDMKWTSHLPTVTIRTGYHGGFHMVAQWFPKIARLEPDGTWAHFPFHRLSEFYADYGTYDVTVVTPRPFVVGAVGALVSEGPAEDAPGPSVTASGAPAAPGASESAASSAAPVPPAPAESAASSAAPVPPAPAASESAASTAAAAPSATDSSEATGEKPAAPVPREKRRFVAEDVHDFAFTAWDRFRALEDTAPGGVKIRCLFPPGYDDVARAEIAQVKFGLGYFGAAYGRYPYGTLTIVHPPSGAGEAGGMEYPTLITTGGSWMRSPLEGRAIEIVTIHELAHQWFYGLVGTNENRWPFLDEGLTSYAESDACEAEWPDASAAELLGLRLGLPALYRAGALQATRDASVSEAASDFVSGQDYGSLVYSRTETAIRTLGNVYGADRVRRAIGAYARRHRFGHPAPADLFAAMREGVGEQAAAALEVALTRPSSVDYAADVVQSEHRPDGKPGYVGHVLVRRRGEIRLPVDVLLIAEDGAVQRVRWEAEREVEWLPYEGAEPLIRAVVDPDHRVLLDENLANNAVSDTGSTFAWRVLEGASFAGGLLARGLLP